MQDQTQSRPLKLLKRTKIRFRLFRLNLFLQFLCLVALLKIAM